MVVLGADAGGWILHQLPSALLKDSGTFLGVFRGRPGVHAPERCFATPE